MANLYILCGTPGSGKTTWAKEQNFDPDRYVYISRDEIRFSLLKEGEDYFAHEDEVVATFYNKINNALADGKHAIADATHLTPGSRKKLVNNVYVEYDYAIAIDLNESLETCLERNENRKGTLGYVPRGQIRRMSSIYVHPCVENEPWLHNVE